MLFSSLEFIFLFLPTTFFLYFIFFRNRNISNIILIFAGLAFYAYGEPRYVWILVGSIVFNTLFAQIISRTTNCLSRKVYLRIAVGVNLAVLFVFKYCNFVLSAFGLPTIGALRLPIGISFYTFQAISYVIDVYHGDVKPADIRKVGLYLAFFPQLIAGPILKYSDVSNRIDNRRESVSEFSEGLFRFAVGFSKKVLLANSFAAVADKVFSWSSIGADYYPVPVTLAWLGSISYSLQIYYDFSGYSDMAIGLAKCFGFQFPENFHYPYSAVSVRDFWSRWHISLTNWFREYVYIPLGGNRNLSMDKTVRNLLIVWFLTGLWHGANWTFIFWGAYYFCFQLLERLTGFPSKRCSSFLGRIYTLLVVNFGWVLFRAKDLYQAGVFYRNMFGLNYNGFTSDLTLLLLKENAPIFMIGIIFAFPIYEKMRIHNRNNAFRGLTYAGIYFAVWLGISYLVNGSYNPFIYFDF